MLEVIAGKGKGKDEHGDGVGDVALQVVEEHKLPQKGEDDDDGTATTTTLIRQDMQDSSSQDHPPLNAQKRSLLMINRKTAIVVVSVLLGVAVLSLLLALLLPGQQHDNPQTRTIIVSLDGFRWDYFHKTATPHMDDVRRAGFHATRMKPCFPSKTFPNHYSLATGLYPESHGIVSNTIYDPTFRETFHMGNNEPKWWLGEPIWKTAERNGIVAATMFWPGSEAHPPTYIRPFNDSVSVRERVDQVVDWMGKGACLLTLYLSNVDHAGHSYGTDSWQVLNAIHEVDEGIGYLTQRLKDVGLFKTTNIVIVSDHGMANTPRDKLIFIDDYISTHGVHISEFSPVAQIWENTDAIYNTLTNIQPKPHWSVYKKEDIPAKYHYQNSVRIAPLIVVADEHYTITARRWANHTLTATHGFNNSLSDMGAIFLAAGPAFMQSAQPIPVLENINVYSLLCYTLGITRGAAPNNGSLTPFHPYLRN